MLHHASSFPAALEEIWEEQGAVIVGAGVAFDDHRLSLKSPDTNTCSYRYSRDTPPTENTSMYEWTIARDQGSLGNHNRPHARPSPTPG
jgi:hypothetical protein